MIIHDVEQGSEEWHQCRLGIPTASEFFRILSPKGKQSTQMDTYANKLIAELLTSKCVDTFEGNAWTERGNELEGEAADFYSLINSERAEVIGFCTDDDKTMGCSPDRLIGEDGLLEIKCPAPQTHVGYMLNKKLDQKYRPQHQGQLLITGRKWVDIISYHPDMKPVIIRAERDEEYISLLRKLLFDFRKLLDEKKKRLGL